MAAEQGTIHKAGFWITCVLVEKPFLVSLLILLTCEIYKITNSEHEAEISHDDNKDEIDQIVPEATLKEKLSKKKDRKQGLERWSGSEALQGKAPKHINDAAKDSVRTALQYSKNLNTGDSADLDQANELMHAIYHLPARLVGSIGSTKCVLIQFQSTIKIIEITVKGAIHVTAKEFPATGRLQPVDER